MSYILEALKHAQERRSQGPVPGLSSQSQPGAARPGDERFWRRLALLALALLLGGLALLGWQRLLGEGDEAAPAVPVALEAAAPASVDAVDAGGSAARGTVAPDSVAPDMAAPRPEGLPAAGEASTLAALQSMQGVRVELDEGEAAVSIQRLPVAREVGRVPAGGTLPRVADAVPVAAPATAALPQRGEEVSGAGMPGEFGPLEHWRQLPGSLQQQLREQPISAHVYAGDPQLRFIRSGGRTLREGDALTAELRVLHITRSGVILGYRNGKYWLRLG